MIDNSIDSNYKTKYLLNKIMPKTNKKGKKTEELEIIKLLKPIKDKIIEIILTKGPISLSSSILELFYDKKIKILEQSEIYDEIRKKMKRNLITIVEKIKNNKGALISYLDSNNYILRIKEILNNSNYFQKLVFKEKECYQIDCINIKNNLKNLLKELEEQYNILIYNPGIHIELKEEKHDNINSKFNVNNSNIINNKKINFNDIHHNQIIINTEINNNDKIKEELERKNNKELIFDINTNFRLDQNIGNNINNKKEFVINKSMKNENSNIKIESNLTKYNIYKKEIIKKNFLKKKKKLSKNKLFTIPYSFNNNDNNLNDNIKTFYNKSKNENSCFDLSIENLSFSCIPRKKDKNRIEKIINIISYKTDELISVFGGENIKEREEEKIMKLKQKINQINLEIKVHEYIIKCWENANINYEEEKKNICILEKINNEINKDFIRLKEELEVLDASHFIINKRNYLKNEINNGEGIKSDFIFNYNVCENIFKRIQKNKNKYLVCLKNISEFIKIVNNIKLNNEENQNANIYIYKEEKDSIKKIEKCLNIFEDLIKKNINKCLTNTSLEKLKEKKNCYRQKLLESF